MVSWDHQGRSANHSSPSMLGSCVSLVRPSSPAAELRVSGRLRFISRTFATGSVWARCRSLVCRRPAAGGCSHGLGSHARVTLVAADLGSGVRVGKEKHRGFCADALVGAPLKTRRCRAVDKSTLTGTWLYASISVLRSLRNSPASKHEHQARQAPGQKIWVLFCCGKNFWKIWLEAHWLSVLQWCL